MFSSSPELKLARELLDQEWRRFKRQAEKHTHRQIPDCCTAAWILPEVMEMIAALGDRPVTDLTPTVRYLLREQSFVDDNGDNVIEEGDEQITEQMTRLVVKVLKRVQERQTIRGENTYQPQNACPMYG